MAVKVSWLTDEQKAVLMQYDEPWTWEEFNKSARDAHALAASVAHQVRMVIVHNVPFPKGNPLTYFRSAFMNQPDNIDRVIVVIDEHTPILLSFLKRLAQVTEKIFPGKSKMLFVQSYDDAMPLLEN